MITKCRWRTKRQEHIVGHTVVLINLASDIIAMAAAIASLVDTALRLRNNRDGNRELNSTESRPAPVGQRVQPHTE